MRLNMFTVISLILYASIYFNRPLLCLTSFFVIIPIWISAISIWDGNFVIGAYISVFHEDANNKWESLCQTRTSKMTDKGIFARIEIYPHTVIFFLLSISALLLSALLIKWNNITSLESLACVFLWIPCIASVFYLGVSQKKLEKVKISYLQEWHRIKTTPGKIDKLINNRLHPEQNINLEIVEEKCFLCKILNSHRKNVNQRSNSSN